MNPERIRIQHEQDQLWQRIRDYRGDLERIISIGLQLGDECLVKGVFNYVLAEMYIADSDLKETE